jgi:hypothetical protein
MTTSNKAFLILIKDLIKEEMEKKQTLLEAPYSGKMDEILVEKLNIIFNNKKSK